MGILLLLLEVANGLLGLASLVFGIMTLIKLYQQQGVGHMLLGLCCSLYLFVWGWQNCDRLGFRKEMRSWTTVVVAQFLLAIVIVAVNMLARSS